MTGRSYAVVIPARNEVRNIGRCLLSVFAQTVKPRRMVVVDDGSTDGTSKILSRLSDKQGSLSYITVNNERHKVRGINISKAINAGIRDVLNDVNHYDYLLKMDADSSLIDKSTVEKLISRMELNPRLGIVGCVSDKGKYMLRHISDGARLYRFACLMDVLEKASPNDGYPIMYGHDSFMIFRARWLGWETRPVNILYSDARPYRRDLFRWFLTGRFRYMNGFTFPHQSLTFIRYIREKPYIVGSFISLVSFAVHHLTDWKIYEDDYYRFIEEDLNQVIRFGLKNLFNREMISKLMR